MLTSKFSCRVLSTFVKILLLIVESKNIVNHVLLAIWLYKRIKLMILMQLRHLMLKKKYVILAMNKIPKDLFNVQIPILDLTYVLLVLNKELKYLSSGFAIWTHEKYLSNLMLKLMTPNSENIKKNVLMVHVVSLCSQL